MHLTGFRTHRQVRQARREFAAKFPHIKTNEDRVAESRMDGFVYALFLALIVIPAAALFADYMTGAYYLADILAALEAVK